MFSGFSRWILLYISALRVAGYAWCIAARVQRTRHALADSRHAVYARVRTGNAAFARLLLALARSSTALLVLPRIDYLHARYFADSLTTITTSSPVSSKSIISLGIHIRARRK